MFDWEEFLGLSGTPGSPPGRERGGNDKSSTWPFYGVLCSLTG